MRALFATIFACFLLLTVAPLAAQTTPTESPPADPPSTQPTPPPTAPSAPPVEQPEPTSADDQLLAAAATPSFAGIEEVERRTVLALLDSRHWPLRAFALMRLERYRPGPELEALITPRLCDESWQVRCYAIAAARRMGVDIPSELLAEESEPAVIRTALRAGLTLDPKIVSRGARVLMRTPRRRPTPSRHRDRRPLRR